MHYHVRIMIDACGAPKGSVELFLGEGRVRTDLC